MPQRQRRRPILSSSTCATRKGQLLHRYREGEARVTASLNDYAFFIWGLSELYETTFKRATLQRHLSFWSTC